LEPSPLPGSHARQAPPTSARVSPRSPDEAEHAQLTLDLAAWLSERLSEEERILLPNASEAQRLLRALRAELT
jgi:hypothetical protein